MNRAMVGIALLLGLVASAAPPAGAAQTGPGLGAVPGDQDTRPRAAVLTATDTDGDRVPDHLEIAWEITDPLLEDTDDDGIPDGAEDADGDGLSAAGEARIGTHAVRSDTDGDGIDDWHDDADGDGRRDGPYQDARPIPAGLTPTLARAADDRPRSYRDGCHQHAGSTPRLCSYGSRAADAPVVVLFGDSHAAQWLPALEVIGRNSGWRIISVTRSSCPAVRVTIVARSAPSLGRLCDTWRDRAIAAIARLRPDLVFVASFIGYDIAGVPAGDLRARRAAWLAGWRWSLRRLGKGAARVVLIGETPHFRDSAVECLTRHQRDIGRCSTPRRKAIHAQWDTREARNAARVGAVYIRTTGLICPYDPCPVILGRRLLVFDTGHLNASSGPALARGLRRLLPSGTTQPVAMPWLLPIAR